MVEFHPGVKPNDPGKARLYFRMFRQDGAVAPSSVDYITMPYIGMLGNDRYGDCVEAANGHVVEQQTYFGQGTEVEVTTQQVLDSYSRITGFNPNDPNTDQGTMIQDGLNDLRKTGLNGHGIAAFAQLDVKNLNDVKLAVAEFGAVDIGFSFPASAMQQFNNRQPWTVVNGSPIEGGHCVLVVGYDANYLYVYTWGAVQKMDYAFWAKYVSEAWAIIDADWINAATGLDVEGVDKHAFGAQFAALTGQPNPFPGNDPTPPPEIDQADKNLAVALHKYVKSRNAVSYVRNAATAWFADKHL